MLLTKSQIETISGGSRLLEQPSRCLEIFKEVKRKGTHLFQRS